LNFTFGYEWKESIYKTHTFEPLIISSTKIADNSPILEDTTINAFIKNSFIDHLTTATRYVFIFNNQLLGKNRNFSYLRGNIEFAGNTLRAINNLSNKLDNETDTSYSIGGIQYAQYIRTDFDFRYYNIINQHSTIVFRLAAGLGVPYGNSQSLPFEKSFFVGGANGIRAWEARNLGPGSYNGKVNFDQIGDIKIEANLESRFKIISIFEGAAFIDAGNIWLSQEDPDRLGAKINTSSFLSELAIGGGFGVRLNFNFFIIRLDAAYKLKDPSYDKNSRWIIDNLSFNKATWNFGIGYPF
jgi:outer membrane protein assembly factor BamA